MIRNNDNNDSLSKSNIKNPNLTYCCRNEAASPQTYLVLKLRPICMPFKFRKSQFEARKFIFEFVGAVLESLAFKIG